MRTPRVVWMAAFAAIQLLVPAAAGAAWNEPSGAPLNSGASGYEPTLTPVGGVAHVAWSEHEGVHVRRLNAAGNGWEQVGQPFGETGVGHDPSLAAVGQTPWVAWTGVEQGEQRIRVSRLDDDGSAWETVGGPLNHSSRAAGSFPHGIAFDAHLAVIEGVPHVAWGEYHDETPMVRVARLNAAGEWEEIGGPVNAGDYGRSFASGLIGIDGVPHVAWLEHDGTNQEIRVSRLNTSGTAWEEVVGGPSPINHASDEHGSLASIVEIDGRPWVAWTEWDGVVNQIRVSRLNSDGTAWEEVVGGARPVNHASDGTAYRPSLTAIGGVPYLAWNEHDGTNYELRVSRLSADESEWEQVIGGESPINSSSDLPAWAPSLTSVGGVPYVAWFEEADVNAVRVSRLEPEFLEQSEKPLPSGALLRTRVRTYGLAYPIAFEYGKGDSLDQRTLATRTAPGEDEDVVERPVVGLDGGTRYSWRTVGFDGYAPTGAAPTRTFVTLGVPPPVVEEPPVGSPPADRLELAVVEPRLRALAGRGVPVRYTLSAPATVSLDVRRCGGKVLARNALGARRASAAGLNKIVWRGRIRGKRPRPGCYVLALRAVGADGTTVTDRAKLRLERRSVRRR